MLDFRAGSYLYAAKIMNTPAQLQSATLNPEYAIDIPPGGWLRGVRLEMRTITPAVGTTFLPGRFATAFVLSATLENMNGDPLIYPMSGDTTLVTSYYQRPWLGNVTLRFDYSTTTSPSFSLFYSLETRRTVGVVDNTDARSQYRFRWTVANTTQVYSVVTTPPAIAWSLYVETYAEPAAKSETGEPIEQRPEGRLLAGITRKQDWNLAPIGSANTIQIANTGNIIRSLTMIFRDSTGNRRDMYNGDVFKWRLDDRSLGTFTDIELTQMINDFYPAINVGQFSKFTGTLTFPRYFYPGSQYGSGWLHTTNTSYLIFEFVTSLANDGWVEIITDELVPLGKFDPSFMHI